MKIIRLVFCSLAILVCIVNDHVDGLQCYICNSHNDSRCAGDKLPDTMKTDCSVAHSGTKSTMCRKITQVIEFEVNGLPPDNRVIRGCGWDESNYKGKCYQRSGFGGRQEVCSCTDDYCNSSSTLMPSALLVLLVIIPMFVLKLF